MRARIARVVRHRDFSQWLTLATVVVTLALVFPQIISSWATLRTPGARPATWSIHLGAD